MVLAVGGAASASLVVAMVSAYRHRKGGAVIANAVYIGLTLWEWKLWADRFTRETGSRAS